MNQLRLENLFRPPANTPEKPRKEQPRHKIRTELWLCLHLPELALQVFEHGEERGRPRVVVEPCGGRSIVVAASAAAGEQGIEPGMGLGAAAALCRGLMVHRRDRRAERARLEQLAERAGRFTSRVSIEPPQELLLEIGASLRLFGGVDALWRQLHASLAPLAGELQHAITPTPLAAIWLARCNRPLVITSADALRSVLGELPLAVLQLEPRLEKRLRNTGMKRLRDLWRLPRDGLARRFGAGLLQILDRALGQSGDPRRSHAPPLHFAATLELPAETRDSRHILGAAKQLLAQLAELLARHDAQVEAIQFGLLSRGHPAHWLTIGLRRGSRDPARLLELFDHHLQPLRLAAPVTALCLESMAIRPATTASRPLFRTPDAPQYREEQWQELLEQLQNRLGAEAICMLRSRPDHRPELAWEQAEPALTTGTSAHRAPRRPLWLLPEPQPLPAPPGNLTLLGGPERIETGWWSAASIRRDYYTARHRDGRRLWIFHDLRHPGRWYLHGLFG